MKIKLTVLCQEREGATHPEGNSSELSNWKNCTLKLVGDRGAKISWLQKYWKGGCMEW